jgi:hypothetical protein
MDEAMGIGLCNGHDRYDAFPKIIRSLKKRERKSERRKDKKEGNREAMVVVD